MIEVIDSGLDLENGKPVTEGWEVVNLVPTQLLKKLKKKMGVQGGLSHPLMPRL